MEKPLGITKKTYNFKGNGPMSNCTFKLTSNIHGTTQLACLEITYKSFSGSSTILVDVHRLKAFISSLEDLLEFAEDHGMIESEKEDGADGDDQNPDYPG